MRPTRVAPLFAAALLAGCAETSRLPERADVGPNPQLVQPVRTMVPTVKVAEAVGWAPGTTPVAAQGLKVNALVTGLDHPRWLYVLPNGDVLVAESNAPPKPKDQEGGIKGWFMKMFMKKAGAGVKSANRITLLRDADGDGVAEVRTAFLENLFSPFGMALVGGELYIANADAVVRVPYREGETRITATPTRLTDLPAGRNHHWTKALIASRDGSKLYATVGSNSNVAEHGMGEEEGRAAIWEIDTRTGAKRLYATGLRNPNGMGWEPASGVLWTVVNERDEIGSDLVPDYLTSVRDGGFYGWPWSYYGQHVDERVKPPRPELVAKAIKPDYALGSHVAPLGLTFAEGARLGPGFASGAFIGRHGSWNRKPLNGYDVIFVPFAQGKPAGMPIDVLTGFVNSKEQAQGRPVGVAIDKRGALLVADDVGNVIWRVSAS
jgi:glucose/arabinose dehydrogenase